MPHNLLYGSVGYTLDPSRAHAVQTASTTPGRVFLYDDNGNMTSDSLRTTTYTPDNMPQTITMNSSTTTFVYDGNGKRVKKTSPAAGTRLYIGKLYECASAGCGNYIFAGNTRIAKSTATDTIFYHPDHLGSTALATDDLGNQVENIAYYPFGETRQDSGTENLNHKYTGQELDYEINLYNYGARLYDPEIGRFISPDTIVPDYVNPQSLNRYAYSLNNPVKYVDPSGHRPLTVGEIGFLRPIFNTPNAGFYQSIDVKSGASWNPIAYSALNVQGRPAITLGNTVYVNKDYYKNDFASASIPSQGLLVHETTHVWQNQTNGVVSTAVGSIVDNLGKGYGYELNASSPAPLSSYGVEQQASLVEDFFYLSNGEKPDNTNASWFVPGGDNSGYQNIYSDILSSAGLGASGQNYTGDSGSYDWDSDWDSGSYDWDSDWDSGSYNWDTGSSGWDW